MQPVTVISSNIRSLCLTGSILSVEFNGGKVYDYQNVSKELLLELLTAESVGKAFNILIKAHPDKHPFAPRG